MVDIDGRDSLDIEVAQKVAMTLASLIGAKSFGMKKSSLEELEPLLQFVFRDDFSADSKKRYVILFLEGNFGSIT